MEELEVEAFHQGVTNLKVVTLGMVGPLQVKGGPPPPGVGRISGLSPF